MDVLLWHSRERKRSNTLFPNARRNSTTGRKSRNLRKGQAPFLKRKFLLLYGDAPTHLSLGELFFLASLKALFISSKKI